MADYESNLRDWMKELTQEEEGTLKQRPDLEALRAYLAGELSEEETEALREILSIDRASARTVRELAALDRLEDSAEEILSPAELAHDLNRLKSRLESPPDEAPAPPVVPASLSPVGSRLQFYRAATFLLGLSLFGLAARSFWPETDSLGVARIRDEILKPLGTDSRGAEPAEFLIEAGIEHLYLTLLFVDVEAHERLLLRIVDPSRPEAFSEHALGISDSGPLTLRVRTDLLPDGPVLLELYGEPGHRLLASYRARISRDPSPGG